MDKTVATVHIEVYENGTRITRDGSAFHIIAGLTRALARGLMDCKKDDVSAEEVCASAFAVLLDECRELEAQGQ
jgi:mannose/fructose-specific phosphotransferase system component IIA